SFGSVNSIKPFPPSGTWTVYGQPVSDARGDLYYTQYTFVANNNQTQAKVFELPAGSKSPKQIGAFVQETNTAHSPPPLAVDRAGKVFVTTADAGKNLAPTIFEIKPSTRTVTTLITGSSAFGPLIASGNVIYGTTSSEVFALNDGAKSFAWTAPFTST